MFTSHRSAAASYGAVHVETSIVDADPHRLIELLYDGALAAIAKARFALENGNTAAKGEATTRAIRIIDEGLKAALDHSAGPVATNLDALYDYMNRTLIRANLENNDARYAEVARLLSGLRGAWRQIAGQVRTLEAAL